MQWFRLRPTFEIHLDVPRETAMEKLLVEQKLHKNDFLMHGEYGELHLPPSEHRFWSPHLSFYVAEREEDSLIHGRFAPRLQIWTMVWVIYLAMAFSAFFGLALAYSQWMLGESAWGMVVVVVGIIAIITLYVVAHLGQQWSSDQMSFLRSKLDEILLKTDLSQ